MNDEMTFYYNCRKCGKKIEASTPSNISPANMIVVPGKKKVEWEFECKKCDGGFLPEKLMDEEGP